jgi:hypothetical protein
MHVHLPKPLHGWREFAGEVGIIVIGVLIALGAEQVVETLHWRNEAKDFRQAVDQELAIDLGAFEFNQLQQRCIRRRLVELQTYLDRTRTNGAVHLAGPIGAPASISQYTSVWDNKDAQVVAHLPVDVRLKYAQFYDEFRNTNGLVETQGQIWAKFLPFEEEGPLTLAERRQLHALIEGARGASYVMDANWPVSAKLAANLGIKAAYLPETREAMRQIPQFALCRPILKSG